MVNASLKDTLAELGHLSCLVSRTPQVPEELAEDLRQVTFAFVTHVFYLGYQKRRLDEVCAELDQL